MENELGGCIVELRSLEWRWVHCKGFRVCGNMMTRMALPNSYSPWWFGLLRDSWVSGEKEWGGCIVTNQNLRRWWWCLCQILPLMMMMIQASQGFFQSGEAIAELEQFFLRSWTLNSNPIMCTFVQLAVQIYIDFVNINILYKCLCMCIIYNNNIIINTLAAMTQVCQEN